MNTYCITTFRTYKSPVLEQYELPWEDIVEFLLDGHSVTTDKFSLKAFNATRYKTLDQVLLENPDGVTKSPFDCAQYVRRTKENTIQIEMLIIDYDDGFTIDQAKDRYKDYQYLGYTSHSHLADGVTQKFRLIFPLLSPIPVFQRTGVNGVDQKEVTLQDITDSISQFAPGSDPSAYNGTQLFFPPSCPPDREKLATSWSNTGKLLDWTLWEINTEQNHHTPVERGDYVSTGRSNRSLSPDQIFHHAKGEVIAREVVGKIEKVACPYHGDTKGSEFLVRHESGVISFTCKHCGTFSLAPERETTDTNENPDNESDLLVFDRVWMSHEDRTEITNILSSIKKKIVSDTGRPKITGRQIASRKTQYKFKSHILYLPEGSG